jgi:hypothetical protein
MIHKLGALLLSLLVVAGCDFATWTVKSVNGGTVVCEWSKVKHKTRTVYMDADAAANLKVGDLCPD